VLAVRHPGFADHETGVLDASGGRREVRVEVGARATLSGHVVQIPPGEARRVQVLVLGGHGAMRTVDAAADGSYRIGGLQPGSYLVRAFAADADEYVSRLFDSMFPLYALAVDSRMIPPRDVTLAEGESRVLDLALDLPPSGVVRGSVSINGQPGRDARAVLRPVAGKAPIAAGMSLRGGCDELGRFAIDKVPAGQYTLAVYGASRQELHSETITVAAGEYVVEVRASAGGLRGRVVAADGAPADELRGSLWVLPGAAAQPADLYEYRRAARAHRIEVRNGAFEDAGLTPGPALVVVEIRGRAPVAATTEIPAGSTRQVDLEAGAPLR
jgi:hypothetical protein